jgi:signal peptidase I
MQNYQQILTKGVQKAKQTKKPSKAKKEPKTTSEKVWSWVKTIFFAILVVMVINGLALASFVVPTGSMENTVMTGDFLFVNKFKYGPTTPQVIPFINVPLPFYKFPAPSEPKKGDVIVFIFPGYRDEVKSSEFQYYLKRCIATAGDTLQVKKNIVYVNGVRQPFPEHSIVDTSDFYDPSDPFRTFPPGKGWTRNNYGPIIIPKKGDRINITPDNYQEWAIFIMREGHKIENTGTTIYIDDKPTYNYVVENNYCFAMGDNRDHSLDSRYWGFVPYKNVVGTPMIVYWSWDTNLPMTQLFAKLGSIRFNRIFKVIR